MPVLRFGSLQTLLYDKTSFFTKLKAIKGVRKAGHVNIWTKSLELSEVDTAILYSGSLSEDDLYSLKKEKVGDFSKIG